MLNQRHIPSLDGFRAISVLLVIFSHLAIRNFDSEQENFLRHFTFGGVGVRIFFVISGFLITYLLLVERKRTGSIDLKRFYIRRLLRIFPVFYFYLLVLVILNFFLDLQIPLIIFLSGGLYVHNFHPWGSHWLIDHSWSLAVEEQFYLLWPFIFTRIVHLRKISVWIAVLVMGSVMRAFHYKYPDISNYFLAPFFMHADFLFSGCFMAYVACYEYDQLVRYFNKAKSVLVYISVVAIGFFSSLEFHPTYDKLFIPIAGSAINVCICFLILYFVVNEKSIGYTFLNLPMVTFIGRLSYSLYIWQQLFISSSGFWFSEFPQNIILTFVTAYLSYQIVERPFLKLKERFKPQL